MTIKSDDIQSRQTVFSSIIKRQPIPQPNIPESFKLLIKKLEGACLKINVQYGESNEFVSCHEFIEKQLSRDVGVSEYDYVVSEVKAAMKKKSA